MSLPLPIYLLGSGYYLHTRIGGKQIKRSLRTSYRRVAIIRAITLLDSLMRKDLPQKYELDLSRGILKADGDEDHARLMQALQAMQAVKIPGARAIQDYRSTYNDIREWLRREKTGQETEQSAIDWDDVVFEVDLLKSQEINLDYILELIFEHNKKIKDKSELTEEIRRIIRASIGNRAKESLIVDFINQTDLDDIPDKAGLIEQFFRFAQHEQLREAVELIASENLNEEAAKRYITVSLKREYASENGADLNAALPKMSPLNPQYLTKKQSVFEKINAFIEKFKGIGGKI